MELPYSNMHYDFEDFCDEALGFTEEAKSITSILAGYCGCREPLHEIGRALCGVETILTALETHLKGEDERYLARIEEIKKERALAGHTPAKALKEDQAPT